MGAFSIPIRLGESVCIRTTEILFDISILESSHSSSVRARPAEDEQRYISMVQDIGDPASLRCSNGMRVVDLADLPIGRDVTIVVGPGSANGLILKSGAKNSLLEFGLI